MKKNKSIASEALMLTLSAIVVRLFGLIFKIPLSYILSDEGMGYFNTAYSVYSFFYVISSSGIPKAISVLIAENSALNDENENEKVFLSSFRVFSIIGILASVIFIMISKPISIFLGSVNSNAAMLMIAPSVFFVAAASSLRGYFNGKLKLFPIAVSELIGAISKLFFGLLFSKISYSMGHTNDIIAAFSILGITIGSLLSFVYLYICKIITAKENKKEKYKIPYLKYIKKIGKIALPITMTSAVGSIFNLLDISLVMHMLQKDGFTDLQANILYGNYTTLVVPMFNLAATVLTPISMVILPILTKIYYNKDEAMFMDKSSLMGEISLIIAMPICFIFLFSSYPILSFVFEKSGAAMAAPLLTVLSPGVIFMALLLVCNTVIESRGNFKAPFISLTCGSIIKLIISFIMITNDNINIIAAPIGTILSYALGFFISYFYLFFKMKIKLRFFSNIFMSGAVSFFASAVSLYAQKYIKITESMQIKTLIALVIFLSLYAVYVFLYYLKSKKRIFNMQIRQKNQV